MRWNTLSALVLLVFVATFPARADEYGLHSEITLDGHPLQCRDFRGRTVMNMRADQLGDVARAWVINRMPVIALDVERMKTLPPKLQVFFFGHECAHHRLGHTYNASLDSENEADCWSIKTARKRGYFGRPDVEAFTPHFAKSRGSRFGHLPGPQRVARLLQCFDDPSEDLMPAQAAASPAPGGG